MRGASFFLSLALLGFASSAQSATLRPEFSSSDRSLQAGETSTFTLDLDLDGAKFVGGKVTIFSGDGDKETFRIRKGDPTQTFSASFLYEEGGDFTASYVVKARYKEKTKQFVDLNDWKTICEVIFELGRKRLNGQLGVQVADAGGELPDTPIVPPVIPPPEPPPPVPVPGALPLFASVLGIGGWLGYRRKRAQREAVAVTA
jgi:hypothetical protein